MLPGMLAHIDQGSGRRNGLKCSLDDPLWRPGHGHDRSVGRFARIDVKELNAFYLPDGLGYRLDNFRPPAFTEIGYALDKGCLDHVAFTFFQR